MNWPWVSRLAYDEACNARDRALAQVDDLLKHVTRMDRLEHGVSELAPGDLPKPDPMPDDLTAYILAWETPDTRASLEEAAWRLHRKGYTWDQVRERIEGLSAELADPS